MAKQNDSDDLVIVDQTRIGSDYASHSLRKAGVDVASGGTSGALLTYIISSFVKDQSLKAALVYVVPTIAIIISLAFRFVSGIITQLWKYFVGEIIRHSYLRKIEKGIKVAQENQSLLEGDASATITQRKDCRDNVIRLRKEKLALTVRGAVSIK